MDQDDSDLEIQEGAAARLHWMTVEDGQLQRRIHPAHSSPCDTIRYIHKNHAKDRGPVLDEDIDVHLLCSVYLPA